VGTDGPRPDFGGTFSYIDALEKLAEGAKHRVVIFEFNAGNHSLRRALANAAAINLVERDGRIPIATSANCLQPDKQNDNGWNQGLLFLDPSQVWLQPAGYVTQMYSRNYLPNLLQCGVTGAKDTLDVSAKRSDDGRTLVLQVVNPTGKAIPTPIHLAGFVPKESVAQITELSGALDARNTAAHPRAIVPQSRPWKHALKNGDTSYTFPPYSVTVLRWE
jgi:alpha-L-arabinofuranosidase